MNVPKKCDMCWELMRGTVGEVGQCEDIYVRCQLPKGHAGMHAGAIATSTDGGLAMRWAKGGVGWVVTGFKI
jgi:hypothetical protein